MIGGYKIQIHAYTDTEQLPRYFQDIFLIQCAKQSVK